MATAVATAAIALSSSAMAANMSPSLTSMAVVGSKVAGRQQILRRRPPARLVYCKEVWSIPELIICVESRSVSSNVTIWSTQDLIQEYSAGPH
ncbi:hypothetical protein L1049_009783 [Liquidambar formosana]|uniref:Uncharacterized protein n=1 Tax=Liquidambar formosana TaxID=63359 RepID=A0AAP0R4B4_LIQFO